MIIVTNFITISFRMLKKSTIILACSPIFPIAMPKAIKNPIKPIGKKSQDKKTPQVNPCVLGRFWTWSMPWYYLLIQFSELSSITHLLGVFTMKSLSPFTIIFRTSFILQCFTNFQFHSPAMCCFFSFFLNWSDHQWYTYTPIFSVPCNC